MHSQLEVKLRDHYPELTSFNVEGKSTRPLEFGCGDGWFPVLVELLGLLDDTRIRSRGDIQIEQVKQKFARLQIYFSCCGFKFDSLEYSLFDAVCAYFSLCICEICGALGRRRRKDGYFVVLCDQHNEDCASISNGFKEASETEINWREYRRRGLDAEGKCFIKTDTEFAPEGRLHLTIYAFPNHITSVRDEPLHRQLKIIRDELVTVGEAYHLFMDLRQVGRLINYYWSDELSRFHDQRNRRG